jgi:hypothetical protein
MQGWRRSLTLAAALVTLLPAAAAAQSAGDEQYEDPFAPGQEQTEPAQPAPTATPPAEPAEPAQTTPAPPTSASTTAPAPVAAASQESLPRTGLGTWLVLVAGLALVASGAALRPHGRRAP